MGWGDADGRVMWGGIVGIEVVCVCVCVGGGGGCFGDFVRNFYVLVLGCDVCELGFCETSFGSIGGVQVYE